MAAAPFIVFNGYPGVGKTAVASALRDAIPDSKLLQNHLLIEPVAALLEREQTGYRDLRKALRTPVLEAISENPDLKDKTIITTYYQETLTDREIDLKEYLESAKGGKRSFVVFDLTCSTEENIKRLESRSASCASSRLSDVNILRDIRENHHVYHFYDHGYQAPDVYEYALDIDELKPAQAAAKLLEYLKGVPGARGP